MRKASLTRGRDATGAAYRLAPCRSGCAPAAPRRTALFANCAPPRSHRKSEQSSKANHDVPIRLDKDLFPSGVAERLRNFSGAAFLPRFVQVGAADSANFSLLNRKF
jgi:hypothetical protein